MPGFKDKWNTAKAAKVTATGAAQSARSNGRALAQACIGVLKPSLGNQWNNAWQTAGFTNHSLAVPENPLPLLNQFRSYFAANPAREVPALTPTISATAAACEAAAQAISAAASASNTSNMTAGMAKSALAGGIKAGRSRLSGLRDELTQLLGPEDDLWYAFGFDKPSDPDTPEVALHLVLTAGAPGSRMIFADWDDARRAESYRATLTNTANPPVKLAEEIVHESEATFTLPATVEAGTAVRLSVTSRNHHGGESGPSEPASGALA